MIPRATNLPFQAERQPEVPWLAKHAWEGEDDLNFLDQVCSTESHSSMRETAGMPIVFGILFSIFDIVIVLLGNTLLHKILNCGLGEHHLAYGDFDIFKKLCRHTNS